MSPFQSYASDEFWDLYEELPLEIRRAADKQFALFERNPSHRSLHLKQVGGLWSARVTEAYRVPALRQENSFYWFWIGSHDEYERLIG